MNTAIPVSDVVAGHRFHAYGYRWQAVAPARYDAFGNTGSSPRYILDAIGIDADAPFRTEMTFGMGLHESCVLCLDVLPALTVFELGVVLNQNADRRRARGVSP